MQNLENFSYYPTYTGAYKMISCPIQFTKAYLFGNPSITFLPPMQSGFDHGYHGPTYQDATQTAVAEYYKFLEELP